MSMKTDCFYANIANFVISISIRTKKDSIPSDIKNRLTEYLKGFLVKKSPKTDFSIDIIDTNYDKVDYLVKKNKGENDVYVKLFTIYQNKIVTFNGINSYTFDFILRNIIMDLLNKTNSFLIHASSCLYNNKAYVFFADNGGGKSTIIKLLKQWSIPLTDDLAILKKEGSNFYLYKVPFICKNPIKGDLIKYKIGGFYFLNKSKDFALKKLEINKDNEYLMKLTKQIYNFKNEKIIKYLYFQNRKKIYTLHFNLKTEDILANYTRIFKG